MLAACSGRAITTASGGGGSASDTATAGKAGALGEAGSVADAGPFAHAGSASIPPRNPNLPAPPDDSCERFQISEAPCVDTVCPPWPCNLAPWANDRWCSPFERLPHCIGSLDCQAVAAPETKQAVLACLAHYQPCTVDADCQDGFCVVDVHHAKGSCEEGSVRSRCREDDDCRGVNLCISVQVDGKRACTDGAEGSLCNIDSECQSRRCVHEPGEAILGMCSSGKPGAPCFVNGTCPPGVPCSVLDDGICQGDTHCLGVATSKPSPGAALCTAGNLGEPCSEDTDCHSGHCPRAMDSVCTAGATGEPCTNAADCAAGFCGPKSKNDEDGSHCTSGEAGEGCREGADCKSKNCDPAPMDSPYWLTCVDRLRITGERCARHADCQNQVCGQNSIGKVCTNGTRGDACG